MYLSLRNDLSKNISIILSLMFVSAGALYCASDFKPVGVDELLFSSKPSSRVGCNESDSRYVAPTDSDPYKVSISFSGAAFRFPYHLGVAAYLQENYYLSKVRFIGASAGAMASILLTCNVDIAKDVIGTKVKSDGTWNVTNDDSWLDKIYGKLKNKSTGVYFNIANVMRDNPLPQLGDDSYKQATDRATFSLTNISSWWPHNERINQFTSRKELIDYVLGSCHIPWLVNGSFSTLVDGQRYIDGWFTDGQPVFDNSTIKVYPYMGSIWSITPLSWLSMYGTTSMSRNRGIYRDGYMYAKSQGDIANGLWEPLKEFRKKCK
jgi:hypothetical protein